MLWRSVEKERTVSFAIILFYFFASGGSNKNVWNTLARNELSEKVWNPWFGFLRLCCIELHCVPSTIVSQFQFLCWSRAFGMRRGTWVVIYRQRDFLLWSRNLAHSSWLFHCCRLVGYFTWLTYFEGLELLFSHLSDSVGGLHEGEEKGK